MKSIKQQLNQLKPIIYQLLITHSEGISEFDLFKKLEDEGYSGFGKAVFKDQMQLFHKHFILFHLLYLIRMDLREKQEAELEINPLCIILRPFIQRCSDQQLSSPDKLSYYYLDLSNLKDTTEDELNSMLNNFWLKIKVFDKRQDALNVLELQEPADLIEIKQQYRRLAMKYHPDRGGCHEKFQQINWAMKVLS
ncbi:MAG: DnaJ domain-containing protein [Methylococcales bacterium]|nr:DnaJ domain-containing protein [Methylococcales bacterium]MBT7409311.1 DnaJ domain-containing protein [Methylococcales bacterium]